MMTDFSANLPSYNPDAEFQALLGQLCFWTDQIAALAADCNVHLKSAIASCERISRNNQAMLASQAEMIRALGGDPASAPASPAQPDFRKESNPTSGSDEGQRLPVVMLSIEEMRRLKPLQLTGWGAQTPCGPEPPAQLNETS